MYNGSPFLLLYQEDIGKSMKTWLSVKGLNQPTSGQYNIQKW
jgi:hypothetical protein